MFPSAPGHCNLKCLATIGGRTRLNYRPELNIGAKGGVQPRACMVVTAPALSATFGDFDLSVAELLRFAGNDRRSEQLITIGSMRRQPTRTAFDGLDCGR